MNIEALHHVIRATAGVTGYKKFLILGSQAILGHCMEKGFDFSFNDSMEVDIAPIPENEIMADLISGTIGEMSPFHQNFGYCADGCSMRTPVFPLGWENRVANYTFESDIDVYFPSPEDLAFSKYIAGREKDLEFVKKLWQEDLLKPDVMVQLLTLLPKERMEGREEIVRQRVTRDMNAYLLHARAAGVER